MQMRDRYYEEAVREACRIGLEAIVHLSGGDTAEDVREGCYRQALGDILHALAPFAAKAGEAGEKKPGEVREPRQGLDLIPGVRMVHFRGPDYNRFVAVRKHPPMTSGYTQEPNVYEIFVNRDSDIADVMVDGRNLFHITGDSVGHCTVSKIAISALRRYLRERVNSSRRRKARNRAAAEGKEA